MDARFIATPPLKRLAGLFLLTLFIIANAAPATWAASLEDSARAVSNLIDPAKLATLRARGANPRVYKYVALLQRAREQGLPPKKVAASAVALAGMNGDAAKLTVKAMVRNLTIAERLGCLDTNSLPQMLQGQAPTIRKGPCQGQELSVDHIIPRSVVPELDNVIANLELMPLRLNEAKNAKVTSRQLDLGRKFHKARLLSDAGLKSLEKAISEPASFTPNAIHSMGPKL